MDGGVMEGNGWAEVLTTIDSASTSPASKGNRSQ
jgi:hypothetical protein